MKLDLDALHGPALADAGLALPLFDVGEMRSQACLLYTSDAADE